jgi:hypothetical protein
MTGKDDGNSGKSRARTHVAADHMTVGHLRPLLRPGKADYTQRTMTTGHLPDALSKGGTPQPGGAKSTGSGQSISPSGGEAGGTHSQSGSTGDKK